MPSTGAVIELADAAPVASLLDTHIDAAMRIIDRSSTPVSSAPAPYTTRTTSHLGTLPSQRAVERCDTMLIIGSTMPWLELYPTSGQAKILQIDRDPTRLGLR